MARRDIIFEFIGLPGAGKSTLATALAAGLAADFDVSMPGRAEYRRKELTLADKVRLDLRSPGLLAYRLARLQHDVRTSGVGLWTVSHSWSQSRYPLVLLDLAARAKRRVLVLDEWLLQRTIDESIRRYGASIGFTRRFAIAPTSRQRLVYVCVNVDETVARERIVAQDQPFRTFAADKDALKIGDVLTLWRAQLQALRPEIARRGLPLIDIDGSAPIDTNVALLREKLRQMMATEADDESPLSIAGPSP